MDKPSHVAKAQHGLHRKLGPAPVYAWVIAAVVGFIVYRRYRAGKASSSAGTGSAMYPTGVIDGGAFDGSGAAIGTGAPSGGGGIGLPQPTLNPATSTPPTSPDPTTAQGPASQPPDITHFPPNNQHPTNDPTGVLQQNRKRWLAHHPQVPPGSASNGTTTGTTTGAQT